MEDTFEVTEDIKTSCLVCNGSLENSEYFTQFKVCPHCKFHYSLSALIRINMIADEGTFREISRGVVSIDPIGFSPKESYKTVIQREQKRTSLSEAVITGMCEVGGNPAVIIVFDFGFMSGSVGCVVGEKITLAIERAVRLNVPLIAVVTSSGSRIEEGLLSIMQMAKISMAIDNLENKDIPFISILANPTTGQAYASFAARADFIFAEPGSVIGLSPLGLMNESKKNKQLSDQIISHYTSENLFETGMIDMVVDRENHRSVLAHIMGLLSMSNRITKRKTPTQLSRKKDVDACISVSLARIKNRPTARQYINAIGNRFFEIHGDRVSNDSSSVTLGIAELSGQSVIVIGQERYSDIKQPVKTINSITPEMFRKIQRGIHLAEKFKLPLLSFIDISDVETSLSAEQGGLAVEIGKTISQMAQLNSPSISIIIGEIGGEASLPLVVADKVLMLEHSVFSVTLLEDAASLIFQDANKAEELAKWFKLTALDCQKFGVVDYIVQEPVLGAHTNIKEVSFDLIRILISTLAELQRKSSRRLLRERQNRFRKVGEYNSKVKAIVYQEFVGIQQLISKKFKDRT